METEITMKAIVLFEPGKPLEVEELDFDPPQEDEVVVGMAASGICHILQMEVGLVPSCRFSGR